VVNDIDIDEAATIRQSEGGKDASSKWHPHTVKVLDMLKRNMTDKSITLSYIELSKGCSRRTAAGVFFELLQLKSWDYIELEQNGEYADIVVAKGNKFEQ